MPPQLAINGIDLSGYLALDDGWRRLADIEIGGRDRAFGGGARNAVRAKKRAVQLRTVPRTQAEAEALRGLLQGDGDSWLFTDAYSRRGLAPSSTSGTISYIGGAYLPGSTYVSCQGFMEYEVGAGSAWTILGVCNASSFGWARVVLRSDGAMYRDGVSQATSLAMWNSGKAVLGISGTKLRLQARRDDAPTWVAATVYATGAFVKGTGGATGTFFEATTGGTSGGSAPTWNTSTGATTADNTVVWTARGPWQGIVDDMVFLPFSVPTSWIAGIDAEMNARAWTAQPRLRVTGDLIPNGPWTMDGKFDGSRNVPIASGTGLSVTHEALDFTLEES